ncbi:MAG: AsmA family protein, partial [Proteobacteria bacterium]|nr:AsmA family protein [Pseudomonadota bacterium]
KKIRDDKVEAEGTYQLTWEQGKELEGKVGKGKVVYRGVTLKDLGGNFSWKEKTLNLTGVKGKMGEGFIQAKGDIGFAKEGQDFSIEVRADRIPIDQCLSLSASNSRRDITGNLSGEVKLNGMWEKKGINKEQLQGNGRISLSQGKIAGIKVLEQASTILGYEGLSPLTVSAGKMDFQVGEGKVKTDGWLKAPDLEVSYKGNVRLDSTLNLVMELRCAPRIFARFTGRAVVDLLKDERGWIVIPLKVKGTWDDPSVRLHSSEFKKKIKDTLHQLYEGFQEGM